LKDLGKIKKYSNALIKVSSVEDIGNILNYLVSFKNNLKEFPELRYLLLSKRISIGDKLKAIKNIFSKYYNNTAIEFISLIIENNDLLIYNDIIDRIIGLLASSSKTKSIHIISHQKYSDNDRLEILSELQNKFNISDSSKSVFDVDPKILGGIKIRIGNKIIDGSVATKLKKIKQSLLGI
tara:strand:- start:91 stop:633 length:543 start_codon:yes stop_codon:yes gene_type:complete